MFRRVLVPTDLTDRTVAALQAGVSLAEPNGELTLLHVIETVPNVPYEELQAFYSRLEARALSRMAAFVGRIGGPGPRVLQEVVYGRRADEIVRFAVQRHCDLIVLASHRVDPAAHDWGTLSYKVGILSPCAVLLVK